MKVKKKRKVKKEQYVTLMKNLPFYTCAGLCHPPLRHLYTLGGEQAKTIIWREVLRSFVISLPFRWPITRVHASTRRHKWPAAVLFRYTFFKNGIHNAIVDEDEVARRTWSDSRSRLSAME